MSLIILIHILDDALHKDSNWSIHYNDVIMDPIASQITSLTIVYSIVYTSADQRKHQSSASLAFVRGIHRGPVNSPHKWPVTRKMLSFDDVIMIAVTKSERQGVSKRRQLNFYFFSTHNTLIRITAKKTSNLCITGPLWREALVTGRIRLENGRQCGQGFMISSRGKAMWRCREPFDHWLRLCIIPKIETALTLV